MNEIADNFAWTRQLECPPTLCNDSVKKMFVFYFYLFIETLAITVSSFGLFALSDCPREYWDFCGRRFPILRIP